MNRGIRAELDDHRIEKIGHKIREVERGDKAEGDLVK